MTRWQGRGRVSPRRSLCCPSSRLQAVAEHELPSAVHRDKLQRPDTRCLCVSCHLQAVTEHEHSEAVKQEELDRARLRGLPPPPQYAQREAGWHDTIDADVQVRSLPWPLQHQVCCWWE